MTEERNSPYDMFARACDEYVAQIGGGMVTGFLVGLEFIDPGGEYRIAAGHPLDQPTFRSMGLAAYLDEWLRDDARQEMGTAIRAALDAVEDDDYPEDN